MLQLFEALVSSGLRAKSRENMMFGLALTILTDWGLSAVHFIADFSWNRRFGNSFILIRQALFTEILRYAKYI